jgi:putative nucleotidyltransferase with HDIG domain
VAQGEFETRVKVQSKDEFRELADSFNFMAGRIEHQVRSLKTSAEIDRAILTSWDLEQIVQTVIARLPELLPHEMAAITILGTRFHEVKGTYYRSADGHETLEASAECSAEEMKLFAGHSEPCVLGSGDERPQFLWPLLRRGMSHFLMVPIFLDGELAAVVSLGHSIDYEWTPEDRQQARSIADQVGVALSNAALLSQLRSSHWGTLTALAKAIDAKSPWTSGHSERVTSMAIKIAKEMGLQGREIDILHAGGLLHDIGKIGVPSEVLDKPGALTDDERRQIQEHVMIGVRILEPMPGFADMLPIVREHHEWFNGQGYPFGIAGDQISRHGRIFAVADVYDALVSDRPYRKGMHLTEVLEIIRNGAGRQFDPEMVEAFLRVVDKEMTTARAETSDEPATTAAQ